MTFTVSRAGNYQIAAITALILLLPPVGQRYRILCRVEHDQLTILVVAVGLRKEGDRADIFRLAQKLVRQGLLGRQISRSGRRSRWTS